MNKGKHLVKKTLHSFKYAFNGLIILLKEEQNARIHFIAAIIAIILGFLLEINTLEWAVILLLIGIIISLEMINSAIERIANFVCEEKNEQIKRIKDLAAGAVLVMAIIAVIIAIIIFIPKIIHLF
ncbi:MAG: diacylglycerol kinase family protein [Hyphomicrobiales bacterium]